MNSLLQKVFYLVVAPFIFFINIVYPMDTPSKKTSPGRQLLLNSIKARMPVCLEKKPFQRSCDEFYGDVGSDHHHYIEFNPNGRYLIEAREKNVARFTVTDMKSQKSSIIPVGNYWKTVVACNKNHALVGGSVFMGKHHLLKISLAHDTILKNFSDKIMPLKPGRYGYQQLAYNPCRSSFISVSESEPNRLFCLHDSVTGDIKNHWKDNYVLGGSDDVSYSPNGRYCLIVGKRYIAMVDPETGKNRWTIAEIAQSVTWHPNNSFFIINSDSEYFVVRAETGKIISTFNDRLEGVPRHCDGPEVEYESGWIDQSFFTADGNYFISLLKHNSKIIVIRNGKTYEVVDFIKGDVDVSTIGVSSDGKYLAYCGRECRGCFEPSIYNIVLYDLEQCKEVVRKSLKKGIRDLRWRPNTHQFITTEYDSTELTLWDIKSDKLCKKAFDDLKNANDWCVGFVADVCNGAVDVNEIDQKTYDTLPESVQILLSSFKNKINKKEAFRLFF